MKKMLKRWKYTAMAVLLCMATIAFLTGCGYASGDDKARVDGYTRGISQDEVYKVDVDGTTCVIYNGSSKGGIDCNWENNNE